MPTYQKHSFRTRVRIVSHVIKEMAGVLGITLKLAQTNGMLERSQESTKQALKIETGE